VHTTLDPSEDAWAEAVWERVRPIEDTMVLRQLATQDQLWHLLMHVIVQHPFRAGAIRDLLLIGAAVAECSEEDLVALEFLIARRPEAEIFREVLAFARQVRGAGVAQDNFKRSAMMVYFFHLYGHSIPGPAILGSDLGSSVFAMLQGPSAYGRWCRTALWRKTPGWSRSPPIAWIEARAPRLGRAVRVGSRMIRLAAAAPLALFIAAVAMRFTKKVVDARN